MTAVLRALLPAVVLALGAAGCTSLSPDGKGLVPGQSTLAEVEAAMGRPADTRQQPNGETWLYYSTQPYGRTMNVARIAPDGTMLDFENRLTDKNVAVIQSHTGKWTREDVRNFIGPSPWIVNYARQEREAWTYYMRPYGSTGTPMVLYVQFSPDGIVREVYEFDEGSLYSRGRR